MPQMKDTLADDQRLEPGQGLASRNGRTVLWVQGDGNLVLYRDGEATWASDTDGQPVAFLAMQSDGNLVLYAPNGEATWASGTDGATATRLVVQDDGNAVIYGSTGPVWASNTVDEEFVGSLPHKLVSRKRVAKGCAATADVTISASGTIVGRVKLVNKNAGRGWTAGWCFMLGDAQENILYASEFKTAGINQALPGSQKRSLSVNEEFPTSLAPKIGSAFFYAKHTPSNKVARLKSTLDDIVEVAEKIAEAKKKMEEARQGSPPPGPTQPRPY